MLIFPNPVKRNYDGLITISGLSDDTNVKITDVAGNLIFETFLRVALQLGMVNHFFQEKECKTGVYLFFCTSPLFNESIVKKLLIYN